MHAAEITGKQAELTMSGMIYYIDDDARRNTSNAIGGHVGIGTGFMDRHALEVALQYSKHRGSESNDELDLWSGTVDYRYFIGSSKFFKPYALGSLGYIENRFPDDADRDTKGLAAALGLGVVTPISRRSALRTELRYRVDRSDPEQQYQDWILAFGFEFSFTKQQDPFNDQDGDGVSDANDRCEDTPRGTPVDGFGCAIASDADGDGVADQLDMCGGTPEDAAVDRHGCMTTDDEPARPEGPATPT